MRRLADLPAACRTVGVSLRLPAGLDSVTSVRQLARLLAATQGRCAVRWGRAPVGAAGRWAGAAGARAGAERCGRDVPAAGTCAAGTRLLPTSFPARWAVRPAPCTPPRRTSARC